MRVDNRKADELRKGDGEGQNEIFPNSEMIDRWWNRHYGFKNYDAMRFFQ